VGLCESALSAKLPLMFRLLFQLFKNGLEWSEHAVFLREWLLPFVPPLVVGVVGYLQAEPWMWILVAMSIVFAMVMMGLVALTAYLERRSPINKLRATVAFACDLTPATTQPQLPFGSNRLQKRAQKSIGDVITLSSTQLNPNVPRTLDKAQFGIDIVNRAPYPISCFLFSASTSIDGLDPPRSTFPKPAYLIPVGGYARFCDDAIDMEQRPCGRLLGTMDMILKYGHPGRENNEIHMDCKVTVVMEHYGFVSMLQSDFTKQSQTTTTV
jgi:hypothetical protein